MTSGNRDRGLAQTRATRLACPGQEDGAQWNQGILPGTDYPGLAKATNPDALLVGPRTPAEFLAVSRQLHAGDGVEWVETIVIHGLSSGRARQQSNWSEASPGGGWTSRRECLQDDLGKRFSERSPLAKLR